MTATGSAGESSSGGDGVEATSTTSTTSTTADDTSAMPTTAEGTGGESTDPAGDPSSGESATHSGEDEGGIHRCGDGQINTGEECDCGGLGCSPDDLMHKTCVDVVDPTAPGPFTGGTLGCNPASCRFDTSMCIACAFVFEFEEDTCPDGFTTAQLDAGAGASTWECGPPTEYAEGPGVNFPSSFGTSLSGPYGANEISALVSAEIDTSEACPAGGLEMTIRHWHNFEGGDTNADGGIVQVSEDGVEWITIAPTDGDPYGSDAVIDATYPPVAGAFGFDATVDDDELSVSTFDLTAYIGSPTLQVRFVFGSNASGELGGWYIDSVEILGTGA